MHRSKQQVITVVTFILVLTQGIATAENLDVALIAASAGGDTTRASQLLALGAHATSRDENGKTALMIAVFQGNTDLAKLLLEKGASVNARSDKGMTALIAAAAGGHKDLIRLLLAKGADANAREEHGLNAYQIALTDRNLDAAALLKDRTKGAESVRVRTTITSLGEAADCLPILSFPDNCSDKVGCVHLGQEVEPTGALTNNEWCMIQKPAVGWVPAVSLKDELASIQEHQNIGAGQAKPKERATEKRESTEEVQHRAAPKASEDVPAPETSGGGGGGGPWWRRR
jgi:uncharacterized protein